MESNGMGCAEMSEWIEWNGGEPPVGPNQKVQVKYALAPHEFEAAESKPTKAKSLQWDHKTYNGKTCWGNITAYPLAPLKS